MKKIKEEPAFITGMEAFLTGNWIVARDSFLVLYKDYSNNENITFILGNIYYSLGDLDKSIQYYKETIGLQTECGNTFYKMGVSYFKMGKFNKSLKVFKLSTQVRGSEHVMVYYYMGLISMHLSKDEDALEYFKKLRELSPQTKMALFFEAQLRIKRHEFEPAIELLCHVLENSPTFAEAHYLLGVCYMGVHKNMKALGSFKKALKLNPSDKRSSLKIDNLSCTDWP